MTTLRSLTFVTVDDLPLTAGVAGLETVNKSIRGQRGYGGPAGYPPGHWIKLSNAKKAEKLALPDRIRRLLAEA